MRNRQLKNQAFINMEGFLSVALQPGMAEILARARLFPEVLTEGQSLLENWKTRRISLDAYYEAARERTREKHALKELVESRIRTIVGLARARYFNDRKVMNELTLQTRYTSKPLDTSYPNVENHTPDNSPEPVDDGFLEHGYVGDQEPVNHDTEPGENDPPEPGEDGASEPGQEHSGGEGSEDSEASVRRAVRESREERNLVVKWRRMVEGLTRLPQEKRATFEKFGFTPEDLTQLLGDLDKLSYALSVQKQGLKARMVQTAGFQKAERDLIEWIYCVRAVLRNNLNQLDTDEPAILAMAEAL